MRKQLRQIDILILCGGLGKRLRQISGNIPKPMVKIGEYVFLDILIKYMAGFGFRRFILGIGYRAKIIKNYYIRNKIPGVDILFSSEEKPLGTGGAVKNAEKLIKSNPFFVLNGDSLCKFDPVSFLSFHNQKKSFISILLKKITNAEEYGKVKLGASSHIIDFYEKSEEAKKCLINAGVYIFDKRIFELMPSQHKYSLERDFFPTMAGKAMFGYPFSNLFIDIGTPERYFKAQKILLKGK